MKIFMVDDEFFTKCKGIIEECNKRGIELEIATSQRDVLRKLPEKFDFDGIILDMAFPVTDSSDFIDIKAGEKVLKELQSNKCQIPILIFSKIEVQEKYPNIFNQIKCWDEERDKFNEFIKYLEGKKYYYLRTN